MNKTLELQQQKESFLKLADVISEKATSEKRGMTKEELTQYNAHLADAEGVDATIQAMAKRSALAANGGAAKRITNQMHDLSLEKPFGYDICPVLWENKANETQKEKDYRIQTGFGEQLQAVRRAEVGRRETDPRLHELNDAYQKRSTPSGMSEQVPADGGFLIYPDFSAEILRLTHETGAVWNMGRRIPISDATNAIKIPAIDQTSRADGSRWGGVRAYWMNEADALTASKAKFRLLELVTKKLATLYYATDELVADAAALGSIILQAFGEEFGFKLDDAFINGDGAGKPQGIMGSPALITIAKETGQQTGTVLFQNIVKMWFRLWIKSRRNAVWFINQDVEQQLIQLSLAVGTGGASVVAGVAAAQDGTPFYGPIYTPPNGLQQPTGLLLGRPVIPIEQAATLSSLGDIILVDPTQYVYIDKGDPQTAASMHVKFLTDEMTYRSVLRVDGQPWWHSAVTPFNGTNTVSPFITLAAR